MSDMGYAIPNSDTGIKFVGIDNAKRSLMLNRSTPIVFRKMSGAECSVDKSTLNNWIRGCASDSLDLIEFNKAMEVYNELLFFKGGIDNNART